MESGTLTWARLPVTASVPKAKEEDFCPTGYFSHRTNLKLCMTHYKDAPKTRLTTGGKCNAGETLERGAYCTGPTTMSAKEMDAAMTADFNELYTGLGIKNGKMPELKQTPPEVGAPALAALNAEKNAERAKQDAANAELQRKAQAEQTAQDNHRNEQYRVMCEASRPNFPSGYPPGHTCHGIATSAATAATTTPAAAVSSSGAAPTAASPATAPKDAAKQEVGKALRGLLGR